MSVSAGRLPVGANTQADGSTCFRVWAPAARSIDLVIYRGGGSCDVRLSADANSYYSARVEGCGAGTRYHYRVNGELLADAASRYQPEGPFGPSEVIDPGRFSWTDNGWRGLSMRGQVLYEIHVGTFTPEGTWRAAANRLPWLAEMGITALEVMPIAEFPGRFGWGYDGVFPYAPTRLYGTPEDLRAFVDRAHALGVGVILDVVYNHLGPEGSVFSRFAPAYYSTRYQGEWGDPLNFDEETSAPVREYFAANGAYWIDEFHLDGLRLDATQGIHDTSPEHILAESGRRARVAAGKRSIILVAENKPQHTRLVKPPSEGGYGLDALWNDDFHHSAIVAATGRREAYFSDHRGTPQELISCAKHGYLFQGQRYAWQKQPRGSSALGLLRTAFVNYLENHDQVANTGDGQRLRQRTTPGRYRALTALYTLMPGTPMLFQGEEFGATTPFGYFADLRPDLAEAVRKGRAEFVSQFPSAATPEIQASLPAPNDAAAFRRYQLDWTSHDSAIVALHRDLIALRQGTRVFRDSAPDGIDGAVVAPELFLLRYFATQPGDERLLFVNLGGDFTEGSIAEPLIAPADGFTWRVAWSSESTSYRGGGTPEIIRADGHRIPGHSAIVMEPAHADRDPNCH